MDFARNLRGFCVGFARNLILFLFEREREGYKRFADCTVTAINFTFSDDSLFLKKSSLVT